MSLLKRIFGLLIVTTMFCSTYTIKETFVTTSNSKHPKHDENIVLERKNNNIFKGRNCLFETNFTKKELQIESKMQNACSFKHLPK